VIRWSASREHSVRFCPGPQGVAGTGGYPSARAWTEDDSNAPGTRLEAARATDRLDAYARAQPLGDEAGAAAGLRVARRSRQGAACSSSKRARN
jgi:hypothetical protein